MRKAKEEFANFYTFIKQKIAEFMNSKKSGFQYALFFSLNLAFLFNPIAKKNVAVLKFTRTFGNGTIYNWDCTRVISNFYVWIFAFTALLFAFWIFFCLWKQKNRSEEENRAVDFLDGIVAVGCVHLLLKAFLFFRQSGQGFFLSYSSVIIDFFIISAFLYIILKLQKSVSFDFYQQAITAIFCIAFFAMTIFKRTGIKSLVFSLFVIFAVAVLFFKFFKNMQKNRIIFSILQSSSITLSFFPLMTSAYFELLNVMNSHDIFVQKIRKYYAIASFLLFCCNFALFIIVCRKNLGLKFWKRISYPALILGLAAISAQPDLSRVFGADIFESANLSVPVSNFLNFGKIPIVSTWGGHLMSGVWQAFLYAILNGDKFGAIFSPYYSWIEFPILAILFFYFAKTVLNEDSAFLTALVFPFAATSCWNYFGMGMLLALAVIFYTKRPTLLRAILIWISFVWCALYRLDMGFSFFMATAFSLAIWCISSKNKFCAKQLLISFFAVAFFGLFLWCILCFLQNANPILRLFEFLKLAASNPTWAFRHIGNTGTNLFAFGYLIVPFITAIFLGICIFSKSLKKRIGVQHWILLLIFGFSYFFNLPRALVRHSLAENSITIVFWSASVFLSGAIAALLNKKRIFLPLLSVFVILSIQFVNAGAFSASPIAENAASQILKNLNEERSSKKQRVIFESGMKNWCGTYKYVLDLILEDDETYLDFMNRTFAYSAIGRECPVYVTQSPLQLSGEFTQKMFIKEISDKIEKVPAAILPLNDSRASASLDGIYNSYRYYKVAEFIFTHYKPLCKYGDFAVWILNERYDSALKKISEFLNENEISLKTFLESDSYSLNNCAIVKNESSFTIQHTGKDPYFSNFGDFIDISAQKNGHIAISIDYKTDTAGTMQLFYTTEKNEGYSEQKSAKAEIAESGTATFSFPVTEHTHIRLDTPEKSTVTIFSIRASSGIEKIDSNYNPQFHSYNLQYLPVLWGEKDAKKAAKNKVLENLPFDVGYSLIDSYFLIDSAKIKKTQGGNYLLLSIVNQGAEKGASFQLGTLSESLIDEFTPKYEFSFSALSGAHDYIFRISADYLWYFENINAVKFDGDFASVDIKLLEGD